MSETYEIARLGAQGDGIAETATGPVYIPFALPGETVVAERSKDRAELVSVEKPSPERVPPACQHFGVCGGCSVQHLDPAAYHAWKRDNLAQPLASQHVEAAVGDLVPCAPHSRRRVTFTARKADKGMLLGYNRAQSNEIVDIVECPISSPQIVAALDRLRVLAGMIATTPKPFQLIVTASDTGLDIAARQSGVPGETRRRQASDFVLREGFARLTIDGEIVVEPRKPSVMFGDASVLLPPGAFLQATASAERSMVDLVGNHLSRARKVADLFAGSGAFALRLARNSEVRAVESDAAALSALDRAFRFTPGLKRVTTERRDLFRRPLTFKELNAFDGLVFDPPRAGAEDQSKQIARSDVPLVAAVSCNPATLARDLSILIAGGYQLKSVTPIDQFLWSPHVEAVALLEKPRKRR
ncbi:class I SAM-dependent RNA methyltransferase [Mesorhizobium sp. 10J20-29]